MHAQIARDVPAGVGKGHVQIHALTELTPRRQDARHWTPRLIDRAGKQFGSLGSGNQFIEVCLDENDTVWLVLHSGSRGVGNELAKVHIENAKGLMKQYFITLEDPDLAYLTAGTPEFDAYIEDMLWAQEYAMGNREAMLTLVVAAVRRFVPSAEIVDQINCHHNFTQMEHHRGNDLWITRKGAIKAAEGDRGVVPGSMGSELASTIPVASIASGLELCPAPRTPHRP